MSENEELDLDALVKTAGSFSRDRFAQFMQLIPPATRKVVLKRLADRHASTSTTDDATGRFDAALPPTVIVEPESENKASEDRTTKRDRVSDDVSMVKLHARGAVGEVFVAFDKKLSRELALKRIRPELPPSDRRVQRFIREAEITANLQHPGIVPIYDLVVSPDKVHYTMPLVCGSTLSDLIKQTHEKFGDRTDPVEWMSAFRPLLTRFIAVCNAIDYAHSENVLHRDLKPDNIMVGTQGQTLILDWGCAKKIDDSETSDESQPQIQDIELAKILGVEPQNRMTVAGSVMGTIAFMSPEQASGDPSRVGTHSDIFGLGATLFNLLTNEVAYENVETDDSSIDKALEEVQQGKHLRVEEIDSRVPAPIAAICLKAMAYDPEKRYASAGDFGRDIDHFLAGEPVSAYREPLIDRAARFIKRHRTAFTTLLGTLLVGFLSLALVTLIVDRQRATLADKNNELASLNDELAAVNERLTNSIEAEKELVTSATVRELQSKQQLYATEMLLASEASSEPGGIGRMRQLVDRWRGPEMSDFRGWEWRHLDALGNSEYWKTDLESTVNRIFTTRDSPIVRVFDADKSLVFNLDIETKKVIGRIRLPRNTTSLDFNRDQSVAAVGLADGSVQILKLNQKGSKPVEFKTLKSTIADIRWNIGGDYLAACDVSGNVAVWQWYERKLKFTDTGVLKQAGKQLLHWSYDGHKLYWTTSSEIFEWGTSDGKKKQIVRDGWIVSPCSSHEGKLLAWVGPGNTIVIHNPESGETKRLSGHQLFVETLHWHPHKHYLLSSSADGSVRIWNADTFKQVRQLLGHGGHVYAASWSSDGSKVASGGLPEDHFHVWDVSNLGSEQDRELKDHPAFAWHPDGDRLAVAEGSNILVEGRQNGSMETLLLKPADSKSPEIYSLAYDDSGQRIACVSAKGRVWTIDAESGEMLKLLDEGSNANLFPRITGKAIQWSPDGKFLAAIGSRGKVRIWDDATGIDIGKKLPSDMDKTLVVCWSPLSDGVSRLAFAGVDNSIFVFDPIEQKVDRTFTQYGWKKGLAWSPDGKQLAVSDRRSINVWNVDSGTRFGTCEGPSSMIRDISWSKSQGRIAALAEDGLICMWNAESLAYCAKFNLHQRIPYSVRWSPNGEHLVSTARNGRLVNQSLSDSNHNSDFPTRKLGTNPSGN
ncbi:serine/threonine-protein kinase [Mariniblastus fucicola]|uniref:Serine/threonine-protein kinase PknD n=1 Tax=Mariniblastus fucicola TaxID=980251 RepID=A0A5B9PNX4_9BACT|nr:serine/threonine-protein kinase [Mariniblastus fucicola]QEG24261.1 Serine/threonine-protein kinase PknD [Mariniblastus fucicola]